MTRDQPHFVSSSRSIQPRKHEALDAPFYSMPCLCRESYFLFASSIRILTPLIFDLRKSIQSLLFDQLRFLHLSISKMRASIFTLALSATPITATLCLLGLPDPLGLCPHSTPKTTPAVVAATPTPTPQKATPTPGPVQPTIISTFTKEPPPPHKETTPPIVVSTTTPPAVIPTTELTPTLAPTIFVSPGGNTAQAGPSTTLTVPAPIWDSTTTLLSVVLSTSATFVPGAAGISSIGVAAVSLGTSSQVGVSGSATSSRPAMVTANAAVVRGVDLVGVLGGLGLVGLLV